MKDYKYYIKPINQTTIQNDKLFIDTSTSSSIQGLKFSINNGFKKAFKRLFGISGRDKTPFEKLYKKQIDFHQNTKVTFYIVGNTALTVFDSAIDPVRPIWVSKIEEWCQARFGIDSTFVYPDPLQSHIVVFQQSKFRAYAGSGGIFKFGWCVELPHDGSKTGKLSRALIRVKSNSISVIQDRKFSSCIDYAERSAAEAINDTIKTLATSINSRHLEVKKELALRMRAITPINASLQELINTSDIIVKNIPEKHDHALWELIRPLMLDETLLRYQLGGYEEKSKNWRRSAHAPIMKIDVFNLLSEIGTNFKNLKLQMAAGDSLTNMGDLEDIAPYIKWPKNDRSNLDYLVKWSKIK